MRASVAILLPVLLGLGGCRTTNYEAKLDDVTWGAELDLDYATVLDRARFVVSREYPEGLDPDLSAEREGDLWTVWQYQVSPFYRKTTRERARVRVEPTDDGRVRVGVAVFRQLNDNIVNPSVISEAKWVSGQRNREREQYLYDRIAARYREFQPSEYWEEKHRDEPRAGLRPDILDRVADADLEGYGEIDRSRDSTPAVAGDPGWEAGSAEEKRKREIEEKVLEADGDG